MRQRVAGGALLRAQPGDAAAGRGRAAARTGRRARPRTAPPGQHRRRREALPRGIGTGTQSARSVGAALPHPPRGRCRARRRDAIAPHRGPLPQYFLGDERTDPGAVGEGGDCRGRDPCPQRRAHRAGEPAGAQSDGHDHDRGQPAAGRRIPLPQGDRIVGPARSDRARQSRLEPEEPGPHGRGAQPLRGSHARPGPRYCRPCSAGRGWRRPTATSSARPNCSTARNSSLRAIPAFSCRAPSCSGGSSPTRRRSNCSRGSPGRTATAGSAPTSSSKKAGCWTRWDATTRPLPPSPRASGSAARSAASSTSTSRRGS